MNRIEKPGLTEGNESTAANGKDKLVEAVLAQLGISFRRVDHPAVFTVEEVYRLEQKIEGTGCKKCLVTSV